jgi:pimeloyl-ACP methyl ester carboxylesterase
MFSLSHITILPLLSSVILLLPCASFSVATILLPAPPGPTNVHITTFPLTDHSRSDPYAPPNTPRRIMLSLFQPTACSHTVQIPYMPPATAAFIDAELSAVGIPNGTFESFRLQTCPCPSESKSRSRHPLVLFSPGQGVSRLNYNVILQWISSLGFTIVSIDHPYDADIVEFPDGTIIHAANISIPDGLPQDLNVRVADARFVLDALSDSSMLNSLPCSSAFRHLNSKRAAIFGHSLGGATAADALLVDSRFVGGLNMDGSIFGHAATTPSSKPFLLFAASGHNQTNDVTWTSFWEQLKGWKLQLEVNATGHLSFEDYPVLAKAIGIDPASNPNIAGLVGTIDGVRMLEILRTYVGAFLHFVLKGEKERVLQGPSKAFPDVLFRNASSGHY